MALKKKLTKAEFEKLSEHFKTEYKAEGDGYVLDVDGDEDTGALKRANDRLKEERKDAKEALRLATEKLEALEEGDSKKRGDVEALEKSWNTKFATQVTEHKTTTDKLTKMLVKATVGGDALKLATELAGKNAKLLIRDIQDRLQADLDGDEPKTKILGKDGKPSALTIDELKKEFVDNPDYSAIIIGSKATGGAGGEKKTGGAPNNENQKPVLLSSLPPEKMVEHLKAIKEGK